MTVLSWWKPGFHVGPGGNMNGIGEHWRELDAAGIPASLKSVDNYGPAGELATIARASGVPHSIVYRLSTAGQNDGFDYDVPQYGLAPAEAARIHWQATIARLPPEFDRELVWLEPINEVDKNRANWLGEFALETAFLALEQGYKVTLFGWSAGEPEPAHWLEPGMMAYLGLCARYQHRLAVSLHEYSYITDNLSQGYPFLVGRFAFLHDACDAAGLARPTIHITEFGWTYEEVPSPEQAMDHLSWAADVYAPYPNIKLAAIWYLGAGFGGIAQKAQQLIAPVTAAALAYTPPEPPDPPPPPPAGCRGAPRVQYNRTYILLQPGADKEWVKAAADGAWDTNRYTIGGSADDAGIGDLDVRNVIAVNPSAWGPGDDGQGLAGFFATYYPGIAYSTIVAATPAELAAALSGDQPPQPPPSGQARLGLHASADPGDLPAGEYALYRDARVEVIKVLSAHSQTSVARLAAENPAAVFVVRAFLSFWDDAGNTGRLISPERFFDDTVADVARTISAIGPGREVLVELHNEPNLVHEGLSYSWMDGVSFNGWLMNVLGLYRSALPAERYVYPGLSPGGSIPGVRQAHAQFSEQSRQAVGAADALGVHLYWAPDYSMAAALGVLNDYINRFPGRPIWVTEASNNKAGLSPANKAAEYIQFWQELRLRPAVGGVTYFVASATNPVFGWGSGGSGETWLGTEIAQLVGAR